MKIHIHNSEKSGIEINERENFHIYFHWHIIIFHLKFTGTKSDFLRRFIRNIYMSIFSPIRSPHAQFFNIIIQVLLSFLQWKIWFLVDFLFVAVYWNLADILEGTFQRANLGIFLSWISYQSIKTSCDKWSVYVIVNKNKCVLIEAL